MGVSVDNIFIFDGRVPIGSFVVELRTTVGDASLMFPVDAGQKPGSDISEAQLSTKGGGLKISRLFKSNEHS